MIDSGTLLRLGDLAKQHPDGFELWGRKLGHAAFVRRLKEWKTLNPWDKLGLVYVATYPKLIDNEFFGTRPSLHRRSPDEACVNRMYNGLRVLNHSDLFDRMDRSGEPPEFGPQRHANVMLLLARIVPDARRIADVLTGKFTPFEGFAVTHVDRPDEPVVNGIGMCLYAERVHADEIIERWARDDPSLANKLRVRPVQITMQSGITFPDDHP